VDNRANRLACVLFGALSLLALGGCVAAVLSGKSAPAELLAIAFAGLGALSAFLQPPRGPSEGK